MAKHEIIKIGSRINTMFGSIEITGYNGHIFYCDDYEVTEDGDEVKEGVRMLTKNEIADLMREVDGRNHTIEFEQDEEEADHQYWYAVQHSEVDPWDYGSYNIDEAYEMLRKEIEDGYLDSLIAVIDDSGSDPVCVDELYL